MTQPATWYLAHLDARTNGQRQHSHGGRDLRRASMGDRRTKREHRLGSDDDQHGLQRRLRRDHWSKDGGGNPTGVMFKGEEVPFTRKTFTAEFSDGSSEDRELLFVPQHGAVRELDTSSNTAITLRWTGNDIDTDINFLTELAQSSTMDEAQGGAVRTSPPSGKTWSSSIRKTTSVGSPTTELPKRTWATNLDGDAPPWLPLDGTGDYEWDDFFALEELPQASNPESGYIATANNAMTGALFDGDPTTLPERQLPAALSSGQRGRLPTLPNRRSDRGDWEPAQSRDHGSNRERRVLTDR